MFMLTKQHQEAILCEKCPNTDIFLVRILEDTNQKKLRIWTLAHNVIQPKQTQDCNLLSSSVKSIVLFFK